MAQCYPEKIISRKLTINGADSARRKTSQPARIKGHYWENLGPRKYSWQIIGPTEVQEIMLAAFLCNMTRISKL